MNNNHRFSIKPLLATLALSLLAATACDRTSEVDATSQAVAVTEKVDSTEVDRAPEATEVDRDTEPRATQMSNRDQTCCKCTKGGGADCYTTSEPCMAGYSNPPIGPCW